MGRYIAAIAAATLTACYGVMLLAAAWLGARSQLAPVHEIVVMLSAGMCALIASAWLFSLRFPRRPKPARRTPSPTAMTGSMSVSPAKMSEDMERYRRLLRVVEEAESAAVPDARCSEYPVLKYGYARKKTSLSEREPS